jgi:hypothetical protein
VILAEKKRLEAKLALHKAGVRNFTDEGSEESEKITLLELTEKVIELRKSEVAQITFRKNLAAMNKLMTVVGPELPLARLSASHLDTYKKARFDYGVEQYKLKKWTYDEDKIKRGVNKDLVNIRAVLRAAVAKKIIPLSLLPEIAFYKTARHILPLYLNDEEIIAIANQLCRARLIPQGGAKLIPHLFLAESV